MTLAERIEALEGSDRGVDYLIAHAIYPVGDVRHGGVGWPEGAVIVPAYPGWQIVPAYTASLDAAMKLVQEDTWHEIKGPRKYLNIPDSCPNYWSVRLESWNHEQCSIGWGTTPALALAAAAIRARG